MTTPKKETSVTPSKQSEQRTCDVPRSDDAPKATTTPLKESAATDGGSSTTAPMAPHGEKMLRRLEKNFVGNPTGDVSKMEPISAADGVGFIEGRNATILEKLKFICAAKNGFKHQKWDHAAIDECLAGKRNELNEKKERNEQDFLNDPDP